MSSRKPVSPRPPTPLSRIVARTEGYTNDANVWDLSIVQGPFSVAPRQTSADVIRNFSPLHVPERRQRRDLKERRVGTLIFLSHALPNSPRRHPSPPPSPSPPSRDRRPPPHHHRVSRAPGSRPASSPLPTGSRTAPCPTPPAASSSPAAPVCVRRQRSAQRRSGGRGAAAGSVVVCPDLCCTAERSPERRPVDSHRVRVRLLRRLTTSVCQLTLCQPCVNPRQGCVLTQPGVC
jgi:hypothetical protein